MAGENSYPQSRTARHRFGACVCKHDPIGLVAWLFRDRLIQAIDEEIDRLSDDNAALSPEVRKERKRQILSDVLKLEHLETAHVDAAGPMATHRLDIDPRALLGIELVGAGDSEEEKRL